MLSPLSVSFVHPFKWIRSTVRHKVGESRHKSLKRVLSPRSTWMRPPLRVTEVQSWGSQTKKYQRRQTLALTHNSLLERNEKILRMRVSGSLSKGDGRFGSFLPWKEKRKLCKIIYTKIIYIISRKFIKIVLIKQKKKSSFNNAAVVYRQLSNICEVINNLNNDKSEADHFKTRL